VNSEKTKFYLEADIELHKETKDLREKASAVINLPHPKDKQPDLLYFSAIFVSSGENLNHAFFLPSELVMSEGTIINKALDVEHKEEEIIGHIYDRAYMDKSGSPLDLKDLSSMDGNNLNKVDMHVAIAGIIYKSRFPNIAEEVASGKWKVSMEAYYQDFDVKVGDMIMSRKEADALGLTSENSNIFGKLARVIKKKKTIAAGELARVLRGIVFSGCGIVKHPANPPSVILETAHSKKEEEDMSEEIILDLDSLDEETDDNNVTSVNIEESDEKLKNHDVSDVNNDSVGICVSFKRRVHEGTFQGPDTKILHEDWCALFEQSCTSFSRDTTDPKCLKSIAYTSAKAIAEELCEKREKDDLRNGLVSNLSAVLEKAAKFCKRRM